MAQNSARVGEIFTAAGIAFTKLGELSMALHTDESAATGRWDNDDVQMIRAAVQRFGEELNKISENIKSKTIAQLKGGIKRKAVEDAKITAGNKKLMTTSTSPVVTNVHSNKSPNKMNKSLSDNESDHNNSDSLSNSHVQVKNIEY